MADPVADLTKAPKQVISFAEDHLIAFVLLIVVALVLFTLAEVHTPGSVTGRVVKAPLIGGWIAKQGAR